MSDQVILGGAHVRVSTVPSLSTGSVTYIRGRVRTRLSMYILSAVCGDLGSTVLTQTYEFRLWKDFGNGTE